MRRGWILAGFLALGGAGCDDEHPVDGGLAKMRSFKDRLCKCTDQACVDDLGEEYAVFQEEQRERIEKSGVEPTASQRSEARKIQAEMEACVRDK